MTAAEVERQLRDAKARIEQARAALASGRPVDLADFEATAEALCGAIMRLPAPEAKALAQELAAMIEEVDRLSIELKARKAELAGSAPDPRRVARAYGAGSGS
ncbi:MAG: hypothetical protein HYR63_25170 [Proteobacteria bacterium]|nr:hypothetical protein [Pseudomonadota bacterium]MBI3497221.1 hypothetical protein [Pseudomonadota bacterium]